MKKSEQRTDFIQWFAEHPTAANLLMIILLGIGVLSAPKLVRETFPYFDAQKVEISVVYPGATAINVEQSICERIEDSIDGVNNVEEVISKSSEGRGSVTVEMAEDGDISQFLTDITTEVDAIDDFPDLAEEPVVKRLGRTDNVVSIAVSGPMSTPDLKVYCEGVKNRLQRYPLISQVSLTGFPEHQLRIEVPAVKLMQNGLSIESIAAIITKQNLDLPAGAVKTQDADILVRFADERTRVHDLEDIIVVSSSTGSELRLGEIATVRDVFDPEEEKVTVNGQRSGLLTIQKTHTQDALAILEEVEAFLAKEKLQAPPTISYTVTRNFSEIVRDRLSLLVTNGVQGLLLVFCVMWLFFNFRLSFWVSMGLPVSFMGAFYLMDMTGMTINMLTMVGLLLALGLIMDDAIVISENVVSKMQQGKSAIEAAVEGTREVSAGVFSSFATTVVVFGSIAMLLEGNIGKVLWVMPFVLIMTLAASIIEAFCILPNHLSHSLRPDFNTSGFRAKFEVKLEYVREHVVGRAADIAIRWRYLTAGLVIACFVMSISLIAGGKVKVVAFPEVDGDLVEARILLPQGTPLTRTEEVVGKLTSALHELDKELTPFQPEERQLLQNVVVQYSVNNDAGESGPHVATVSADLLSAEERSTDINDFLNLWRDKVGDVPDVITIAFKEPVIGPAGQAIDIRLQGSDFAVLKESSLELMNWLQEYNGVVDLTDDLRPGKPEIEVRLKKGALAAGVDAGTIAKQLRAALQGTSGGELQDYGEFYEVDVRLAEEDRNTLADLDYFYITGSDGQQIPLRAVANLNEGRGLARITRIDSMRTVSVKGDVNTEIANVNEILAHTTQNFLPDFQVKYPGVEITMSGQKAESEKTGGSMRKAFLVGIFGVFILLSFQFKSYSEPFIIMLAIPLSLIGVITGHYLMGLELSMPSFMGFVSLAGIVINDSILLVEFIRIKRQEGMSIPEAAGAASRMRFRAVLLTSMTTIAGLIPLLSERSTQAQILVPLVCSIVFGLATATLLVLLVVPVFYSIFGDLGLVREVEKNDG
ncbi:MAG: efflux RND transporter permease subunit [Desulfovibrio sp.]